MIRQIAGVPSPGVTAIRLGASLVQLYTAMVYRGPGIVTDILEGLIVLLERDGFSNVADAVGVDVAKGQRLPPRSLKAKDQ